MKTNIFLAIFLVAVTQTVFAQSQFEIKSERPNEKFYKGVISQEIIQADTSFKKWYTDNLKNYTPNAKALAGLKAQADSLQLIVFMGTWCEDSHVIIPKLFALLDAAGFSKNNVTVIGVDRDKKTIGHLAEALGVTKVPTIIVMKNGREKGRVVEYGKYGLFDMELGEIVNN